MSIKDLRDWARILDSAGQSRAAQELYKSANEWAVLESVNESLKHQLSMCRKALSVVPVDDSELPWENP